MLLYAAFTLGLVGSMHCLGMCGPIAMALPVRTRHMGLKVVKYLLYNIGRIVTYSALGLVVGVIGTFFVLAGLQQVLTIASGLLIIFSVMIVYQPFQLAWIEKISSVVRYFIKQGIGYFLKQTNGYNLFFLGMLNGLLPCGMIYTALLGAIACGDMFSGALFMMSFGLGTVPLMLLVCFAGSVVSDKWRHRLNSLQPAFALTIGALLILRGLHVHVSDYIPVEVGHSIYNCR